MGRGYFAQKTHQAAGGGQQPQELTGGPGGPGGPFGPSSPRGPCWGKTSRVSVSSPLLRATVSVDRGALVNG